MIYDLTSNNSIRKFIALFSQRKYSLVIQLI